MPRRGGGGRPRPKSAPPPSTAKHSSAPPPPAIYQPPSFLGGVAGAIAQGAAFGGGSAIAHRAVDAVAGPRTVHHEHTTVTSNSSQAQQPVRSSDDMCINAGKAFQECISANVNEIGKCQFYLDMLNECKKSSESGTSQQ